MTLHEKKVEKQVYSSKNRRNVKNREQQHDFIKGNIPLKEPKRAKIDARV